MVSKFLPALPYFGLILCAHGLWILGNEFRLSSKDILTWELVLFLSSFEIGLFLVNDFLDLASVASHVLFFMVILQDSRFLKLRKKAILVSLLFSSIASVGVSFFAYPFFRSSGGQVFMYFRFAPSIQIPSFYILVFLTALVSLLFSYCWMSYLDSLLISFERRPPTASVLKSIVVYIQIIPIVLSPLAILQVFGNATLLQTATVFLANLCFSQMASFFVCLSFVTGGHRIFYLKNLGVTSLYSLISFAALVLVIFNFVAQNVDSGSLAFALIVCSMFASSLGVISSRISR